MTLLSFLYTCVYTLPTYLLLAHIQVKDVKEKALQLLAKEMGTTTTAPEDQKAQEGE